MCTSKHVDGRAANGCSAQSTRCENSPTTSTLKVKIASSEYAAAAAATAALARRNQKRRAARACLGCRARKVRCDVVECLPCRNCKWDGIECVIQHGRRKHNAKKFAVEDDLTYTVVSSKTERPLMMSHTPTEPSTVSLGWTAVAEPDTLSPSTTSTSLAGDDDKLSMFSKTSPTDGVISNISDDEPVNETMSHDHERQPHSLGLLLSSMADVLRKSSWEIVDAPAPKALHAQQAIALRLPDFMKPPSKDLDYSTLDYLQSNGAFDLPSEGAQRSLLRAYILGVHYNMPCVDVHQLSRAQGSPSDERGSVSLLLYQAVMFAGAMYVDQTLLESMGYTSRPAALCELFRRAKLLYSMEFDKDPASVVQTLLLFSLRSPAASKQQTPSCWIQLAVNMIRQDQFQCQATRATLPEREASMWKRLWWCCIVRDTFNALGEFHAPSIRDDECEISLLELDDFDVTPIHDESIPGTFLRNIEEQTRLAELFIELGDLSLRLSRILWIQSHSTGMAAPSQTDELSLSLSRWYQDLPPSCQLQSSQLMVWDNDNQASLVDVQRSFLHMTYHATIMTLHRQSVIPASCFSEQHQPEQNLAAQSANSILQLAAGLVSCGQGDLMPVTGVALLLPALIVHSLDASIHAADNKNAGDAQLSMKILESMSQRFAFADMAASYLDQLRQVAQTSTRTKNRSKSRSRERELSAASGGTPPLPTDSSRTLSLPPASLQQAAFESTSPGAALSVDSPDITQLGAAMSERNDFGDLDMSSPESISFEQLMSEPLTSATDFTTSWEYLSPIGAETKEHVILATERVHVVDPMSADGRGEGIFHHIEGEIIAMLGSC